MSIITLTSDYGLRDHYVGALKGKIYSQFSDAKIVDLSHDITPFNLAETAYILESSYSSFPKGTVHLVGVDSERKDGTHHIAMLWNSQYFICADNGILSMISEKILPEKIVAINIHDRLPADASDMDVLAVVSCHLAKGGQLNVIGKEITELHEKRELTPVIADDHSSIKGFVVYIDHFGNVVTNITKRLFQEIGKGRAYEVVIRESLTKLGVGNIKQIRDKYSDIVTVKDGFYDGEKLAIFNEAGNLEIALYRSDPKNHGGAATLLGLQYRSAITIQFK